MPNKKNDKHAFTVRYPGIQRVPYTEIHICEPSEMERIGHDRAMVKFKAIWDTGASRSVITQPVIEKLGLIPRDRIVSYTANGQRDSLVYIVNFLLPNRVIFPFVQVIDGDVLNFDALIGMDIICQGDFAITNKDMQTVMSFQSPSTHCYDFVRQIDQSHKTKIKSSDEKKQNAPLK